MIPDEIDPVIDFSWFYFIGMNKLGFSEKRVGRLTVTTFNRLYKHYKDAFDLEMRLTQNNTTYTEAFNRAQKAETWF